jgi:adenylate cyclase
MKHPVERRLAAILAADVAGYSRLMGADEEGTLDRLKAHRRELVDPTIEEHRGRIVRTTGDGMLAEFPSVVDAVRCAVEVQRAMVDRNAGTPKDKLITFRIGVNLGDVIIDGDDIRRILSPAADAVRSRRGGRLGALLRPAPMTDPRSWRRSASR